MLVRPGTHNGRGGSRTRTWSAWSRGRFAPCTQAGLDGDGAEGYDDMAVGTLTLAALRRSKYRKLPRFPSEWIGRVRRQSIHKVLRRLEGNLGNAASTRCNCSTSQPTRRVL